MNFYFLIKIGRLTVFKKYPTGISFRWEARMPRGVVNG